MGVSRRSLRWAVPTTALAVLLAWGVLGGGIRLGAAPAPAGPSPAGPFPTGEVTVGGGPLVVPLPTDHLRPIRLLPAAPHDARRLTWNLFGRQDGGRKLLLFVDVSCTRILGATASEHPNRVTLRVYGTHHRGFCVASRVTALASVRLPHPLGTRTLVHG